MGHTAVAGSDGAWLAATLPEKNLSDLTFAFELCVFFKARSAFFPSSNSSGGNAHDTQHHKLGTLTPRQGLLNEFKTKKEVSHIKPSIICVGEQLCRKTSCRREEGRLSPSRKTTFTKTTSGQNVLFAIVF